MATKLGLFTALAALTVMVSPSTAAAPKPAPTLTVSLTVTLQGPGNTAGVPFIVEASRSGKPLPQLLGVRSGKTSSVKFAAVSQPDKLCLVLDPQKQWQMSTPGSECVAVLVGSRRVSGSRAVRWTLTAKLSMPLVRVDFPRLPNDPFIWHITFTGDCAGGGTQSVEAYVQGPTGEDWKEPIDRGGFKGLYSGPCEARVDGYTAWNTTVVYKFSDWGQKATPAVFPFVAGPGAHIYARVTNLNGT